MVLMFWLAFALGATSSASNARNIWLPNDAIGGAWVQSDTPEMPDVSATTDPVRQKADEMTRRQGGSVGPATPERPTAPRRGL